MNIDYKQKLIKYNRKNELIINQLGGIKGSNKSTYYFCNVEAAKRICAITDAKSTYDFNSNPRDALSQNDINHIFGVTTGTDVIMHPITSFLSTFLKSDSYLGYKVEQGESIIKYVGTYDKSSKDIIKINNINKSHLDKKNIVLLIDCDKVINSFEDAKQIANYLYHVSINKYTNTNKYTIINTVIELQINTLTSNKCVRMHVFK